MHHSVYWSCCHSLQHTLTYVSKNFIHLVAATTNHKVPSWMSNASLGCSIVAMEVELRVRICLEGDVIDNGQLERDEKGNKKEEA